jgi:hypothetical protein
LPFAFSVILDRVPRAPILSALAATILLAGCPAAGPAPAPPPAVTPPPASSAPAAPAAAPTVAAADAGAADAGPPRLDVDRVLFPEAAGAPLGAAGCRAVTDEGERTRCLFAARFEDDKEGFARAVALWEATGNVAGVEVEQDMDGGFRGHIHIVPEVPAGKHRRHLDWVAAASRDFDRFFEGLAPAASAPLHYRHRPLAYRFFRSVGRSTPSAYAGEWTVSYNVSGSLHVSAAAVRETLFHEIFHINDAAHDDWSVRVLGPIFDAIVGRCGTAPACLRPYAPGDTMVRGGTYYAFQPDNGQRVHEYAAELAARYYREQRAAQGKERFGRPSFKCGPDENRRAWALLIAEFFGGADLVAACPNGSRPF